MIDIIIATYNRIEKATELALKVISLSGDYLNKVIIVDSSYLSSNNKSVFHNNKIHYVHSIHKNQPYQRYLGFKNSEREYLVFLDDDMEIVDNSFLQQIYELFAGNSYT